MKPADLPAPGDPSAEIAALIATLHDAQQRLEVLTEGEVDAVADRDGRTFLLRRAQEQLRHSEAAKQAAILNALPAHIALLDTRGVIVSVNEAWRQLSCPDANLGPGHPVGLNYLEICESASAAGPSDARLAADGIRSVLSGDARNFSIEYACHSAAEKRWLLMTVTPLADDRPNGVVVMHLDITERRQLAELQRTATQLLHNVVENIPTAVQLKSVQDGFRIQLWNKAAERMYGLPREAAIGRNVHDLWPKADADRMHASDLELTASGKLQDFPDRLAQTKTRGDIRVHLRKVALLDADGKATHLLVVVDDISAQLKHVEDLRRFRAAMDISVDAIVLIDRASMRYIDVNQTLCDLTGRTREELIGMTPMDLLGQSQETLEREYDALIACSGNAAEIAEGLYHRNDGSSMPIEKRRQALRTEHGWIIVGTTRDITERKHAEEILEKRAAELERFHRLSVGRELQMIELKKDVNALSATAGRSSPYDLSKLMLDEKVAEHTQELNESILATLNMMEDAVRQREIAEQAFLELEQSQEQLVEGSRQRGMAEVATSVLHNVGNVLNSVNVSASLVSDSIGNSRAAGMAKIVALLREHEDDLGNYITNDSKGKHILAFLDEIALEWLAQQQMVIRELASLRTNIDHIKEIVVLQQSHAKGSASAEIVNVRDLVEDSLRMNADGLKHDRMRVIREFEEVAPISVEKHKVLQILVNLVRNAKHACDDLKGAERRMTLRIAKVNDRIRISVNDNGVGIAPENLTRIFAHGFTTRKDGHGFGLHSGALAATELGGSLKAHSDGPGKGATFTLELGQQAPGV